jgi:TolB-like protein/DNA-binding SARP family transcriptional activator
MPSSAESRTSRATTLTRNSGGCYLRLELPKWSVPHPSCCLTSIRISCLGGLRIERGGEVIDDLPAQPVRSALLLYLALERRATRDELVALCWPERDAERARHSLSQTLYQLRGVLGEEWVDARADQVAVSAAMAVDALEFDAAAEAGRDEEAFSLYDGPFLDGYHVGGTAAFESWVDRWRSRLTRKHARVCRRLAGARAAGGDTEGALGVARQWCDLDPLDDEAQHRLIELLALSGRRADALRQYEEYERLVATELGVEPLDETKAMVASIRDGAVLRSGAAALPAPAVPPSPAQTPTPPAPEASAAARSVGPSALQDGPGRRRRLRPATIAGLGAALTVVIAGALYLGVNPSASDRAAAPGIVAGPSGIAVLPFANMSPDPDQAYFSDGITEDLLTALSRIDGLRVVSRTSVMRYRGSDLGVAAIAAELGVRYLVEGSVRREDENVRITAQLIDAARDAHLWAETYDRELTGVFGIQSEIAQQIADALRRRLPPEERSRIAAGGTASPAAYDLLLRGREYLSRPGAGDVRKFGPAMRFFREALDADPAFARAHVGLSAAFSSHTGLPPALVRDSALTHARAAVELDPALAEAWAMLGWAHLVAWDPPAAEHAFRRALSLDPNDANALAGLARVVRLHGRADESVRLQARVVELDPFSTGTVTDLGGFLMDLGDLAAAETLYRRGIELAPDHPLPSFDLAQIHLIRGEQAEAEAVMEALGAAAADHPGTLFLLGRYHALRGRYHDAEAELARAAALLEGAATTVALQRAYVAHRLGHTERMMELLRSAETDLLAREREGFVIPRLRVQLQALLGDRDAALATIREHWRSGLYGSGMQAGPQIGVYWLDADPLLQGLREDPDFQALLSEVREELDRQRVGLYASGHAATTDRVSFP